MDSKTLSMINKYCSGNINFGDDFTQEDDDNNEIISHTSHCMFTNPLIQTSFSLYSTLRRMIIRKENWTMIHYWYKWKEMSFARRRCVVESWRNNYGNDWRDADVEGDGDGDVDVDDTGVRSSVSNNNRNIIQRVWDETDIVGDNDEECYNESTNDNRMNINTTFKTYFMPICTRLAIWLKDKIRYNFSMFYFKAIWYIKESRSSCNSNSNRNEMLIIDKWNEKVYGLEKLNKKYENILEEKSNIIINKTDEIEAWTEKIEELSKNKNNNNNKLNIIQEVLCTRCSRSLEESIIIETSNTDKRLIQEQITQIEKLKKEIKSWLEENSTNKKRLSELDEIKYEFEAWSKTWLVDKCESGIQTDEISQIKSVNSGGNLMKRPKTSAPAVAKQPKKKTGNVVNINSTTNNFNSSINTMNTFNISTNTNTNTNINTELKESLTSWKFDNSILSNELLNLNKECTKWRSENRILSDKFTKTEKEKTEITQKYKTKTENFDKIKKENAEWVTMIQGSKYKNIISIENDNKKLKTQLTEYETEWNMWRKKSEDNETKVREQGWQIDKMKKTIESYDTFKSQKENLILENTKYESQIKRWSYDIEESKNLLEKQSIIINAKEKEIEKLNNDVSYYTYNLKKSKADHERAWQDAITYEKIVRKMEKDIQVLQSRIK